MTNFEAYFDPDHPAGGNNIAREEAELAAPIEVLLKEHDTGRWKYDRIDCCFTGEDADRDSTGNQGIELTGVNDEELTFALHCGKTFAGTNVCLNLPDDTPDDKYEKAREEYLDNAFEIVTGCGYAGEWSGEDWHLSCCETFKVPYCIDEETGECDTERQWKAIYEGYEKAVANWDREISYASELCEQLAGWKLDNEEGER